MALKIISESNGVLIHCDADHCSPEERAVIDAAETLYEHDSYHSYRAHDDLANSALVSLRTKVTHLLAARARKETM